MRFVRSHQGLRGAIDGVVSEGNSTGCGVCAAMFNGVKMSLRDGYQRPDLASTLSSDEPAAVRDFSRVCPGVGLRAPSAAASGPNFHPVFGRFTEAWEGHAADPAVRRAGSSGGVLTALSEWLLETGEAKRVVGAAMDPSRPTRTVSISMTSPAQVRESSGSRYAPVSIASCSAAAEDVVVGKPCEIAATRARHLAAKSRPPLLLSFFCAGTPSQYATDDLVQELGHVVEGVESLRYRGDGWPGDFVVTSDRGRSVLSYDESWGQHLGRRLQPRCKICVDGTGEYSDVSVGDYWEGDDRGYPVFDSAPGKSVVIARTDRGRDLLKRACEAGILELVPVTLDEVAAVQPLQRMRRLTLAGRLLGRRSAGSAVPKYRGFRLWSSLVRYPLVNLRAARGARGRTRRERLSAGRRP